MTSSIDNDANRQSHPSRFYAKLIGAALVVFAILAALSFLPPPLRAGDRARLETARTQIGAFKTALDLFKYYNGHFPIGTNGLQDLVVKPVNATTDWIQTLDRVPTDPWSNHYLYICPGKHNTNFYDLSSAGRDGIFGTKDDVRNWD